MIFNRRRKRIPLPSNLGLQRSSLDQQDEMSGSNEKAPNDGTGTAGAVTLFTPLTHPILTSVDPVPISKFIRERERYERQVQEKKAELQTLKAASYKVSIDADLLQTLVFLGEFEKIAPDVRPNTSKHLSTGSSPRPRLDSTQK